MAFGLKGTDTERDDRYLKLEEGVTRVRFLDAEPVTKWTHWIGRRPLNCPGPKVCPACAARRAKANREGGTEWKNYLRLQKVGLVRVLVYGDDEPKVKILAYPGSLGDAFDILIEDHGNILNYDVKIRKTKDGKRDWDVKYSASKPADDLYKPAYDAIVEENSYDLAGEAAPATLEAIVAAIRGEDNPAAEVVQDAFTGDRASASTLRTLEAAMAKHSPDKAKPMSYEDYAIDARAITESEAVDYIKSLAPELLEVS